jgi:hypothetical protein
MEKRCSSFSGDNVRAGTVQFILRVLFVSTELLPAQCIDYVWFWLSIPEIWSVEETKYVLTWNGKNKSFDVSYQIEDIFWKSDLVLRTSLFSAYRTK